ncbi:CMP-N-acetylneuraminate-beta-1,4-galactoside alpha-2,3-sialyltransferase [Bagarius yarrelli]|uniref:CMP-N-acetylneuraminate-beta-1,4-galactoside alpha-2,3-sialyltransferase n=1 Tax=Bagarius yarrelli TaxID=175774 RepID=A0A556VY39_BAGYA|nr:CMP-N-acetylneuraminate-beta-1,4-galactoside alpha-2,3-sialyltransferase [Bagarius yarrelli]
MKPRSHCMTAAGIKPNINLCVSEVDIDSSSSMGRLVAAGIVYDKQGFLIKPDGRLPLELQYKYGNLSKGESSNVPTVYKTPGDISLALKQKLVHVTRVGLSVGPLSGSRWFVRPALMFLDKNFQKLSKISSYPPPFGMKSQDKIIHSILDKAKNYGLGPELDRYHLFILFVITLQDYFRLFKAVFVLCSLSCKRCIIIGNGGILFNKSLGAKIDEYDVVVRLNEAPVRGYEKDVGSKTTMRITYPEGAIQKPELYEKSSLFVLSAFKPHDFKWLRHIVFKEKLRGADGFWKSVARVVPREAEDIRILNPHFIQEAAFQFIGLPHNNGLMGRGVIFLINACLLEIVVGQRLEDKREEFQLTTPMAQKEQRRSPGAAVFYYPSLAEEGEEYRTRWHRSLADVSIAYRKSRKERKNRKRQRENLNQDCHLEKKQMRVRDLGLGYDSDEIVLFKYCVGTCMSSRRNYDMALRILTENGSILGRDVSTHPCCRPTRFEAVSFMDTRTNWQTIRWLSAANCSCVG